MKNDLPQDTYLSESCYLHFPKEDEILLNIENFSFKRFFFHVKEFTDFEEKLLSSVKQRIEKLVNDDLFKSLLNDKEKLLRYLHLTNNNEDATLKVLKRFSDLYTKYKISTKSIEKEVNICKIGNSGILKLIGRDKKMRPILLNDVNTLSSFSNSIQDVIETYIFFINYIIENMMLPGQIEQIILIIKPYYNQEIHKIFLQVFEFIQFYFPCRFSNIVTLIDEHTVEINNNVITEYSVTEYNKDCINVINKKSIQEFTYLFSQEIIKKIIKESPQSKYFPPSIDNSITFDLEEEKSENLISKRDYLILFSNPLNRNFYRLNEKIISNNFDLDVLGSKEFKLENFETFNPKLIKIKKNDNNSIETEENSQGKDKKDLTKINEKIKMIKNEYNILKTNKISLTKNGNKPKYTNKDSADLLKISEEIKNRMANKSFSFLENESFENLNHSRNTGNIESIDKKKVRSTNLDMKQRGFIIDCSQRNESCCKMEDKCLII